MEITSWIPSIGQPRILNFSRYLKCYERLGLVSLTLQQPETLAVFASDIDSAERKEYLVESG